MKMSIFCRSSALVALTLLLTLNGNFANTIGSRSVMESPSKSTNESPLKLRRQSIRDKSEMTRLEEAEEPAEKVPEVGLIDTVTQNKDVGVLRRKTEDLHDATLFSTTDTSFSRKSLTTILKPRQRHSWGSHPIGSKKSFVVNDPSGELRWFAYFYDQAVATVLQTRNGTMLKCTVQENIEEWEQKAALQYLGDIMPLRPVPFEVMVHLVTLCGTLNMPQTQGQVSDDTVPSLWWLDFSSFQGILPGTLWCGVRDRATYYHELGPRQSVDTCCRAHDLCPIKMLSMTTRYGVTNLGIRTLLHCSCDLEFYRCLKAANTDVANMVGQVYFNYLTPKCLDAPPSVKNRRKKSPGAGSVSSASSRTQVRDGAGRYECVKFDQEGECRRWVLHPQDFSVELDIARLDLKY